MSRSRRARATTSCPASDAADTTSWPSIPAAPVTRRRIADTLALALVRQEPVPVRAPDDAAGRGQAREGEGDRRPEAPIMRPMAAWVIGSGRTLPVSADRPSRAASWPKVASMRSSARGNCEIAPLTAIRCSWSDSRPCSSFISCGKRAATLTKRPSRQARTHQDSADTVRRASKPSPRGGAGSRTSPETSVSATIRSSKATSLRSTPAERIAAKAPPAAACGSIAPGGTLTAGTIRRMPAGTQRANPGSVSARSMQAGGMDMTMRTSRLSPPGRRSATCRQTPARSPARSPCLRYRVYEGRQRARSVPTRQRSSGRNLRE